jgi:holo-[acyl-carrier protein] synthase
MIGIGTDIIEVKRIQEAIERHGQPFLDKIFTKEEQSYCLKNKESARHFAGHFAAKEAIAKALGVGIGGDLAWHDMEINHNEKGQPYCQLSHAAADRFHTATILLSISHCKEYATATALYS